MIQLQYNHLVHFIDNAISQNINRNKILYQT